MAHVKFWPFARGRKKYNHKRFNKIHRFICDQTAESIADASSPSEGMIQILNTRNPSILSLKLLRKEIFDELETVRILTFPSEAPYWLLAPSP